MVCITELWYDCIMEDVVGIQGMNKQQCDCVRDIRMGLLNLLATKGELHQPDFIQISYRAHLWDVVYCVGTHLICVHAFYLCIPALYHSNAFQPLNSSRCISINALHNIAVFPTSLAVKCIWLASAHFPDLHFHLAKGTRFIKPYTKRLPCSYASFWLLLANQIAAFQWSTFS